MMYIPRKVTRDKLVFTGNTTHPLNKWHENNSNSLENQS
jgi:hypothetical protein